MTIKFRIPKPERGTKTEYRRYNEHMERVAMKFMKGEHPGYKFIKSKAKYSEEYENYQLFLTMTLIIRNGKDKHSIIDINV